MEFDVIVIGAGSAGCAVAGGLAEAGVGTVCVLEAGPSDAHPAVKVPFGLLHLMGSRRDWRYRTAPQTALDGRQVKVPRGRLVGGSSSINSMVWLRGRSDDYAAWGPGWDWPMVGPAFEAVEARVAPRRLPDPHALSISFGRALGANADGPPTPERESAGVFEVNMRRGRRWSAADAFLRPAMATGRLEVMRRAEVDRIGFEDRRACRVHLASGRVLRARRGVVLAAGSIGSPAILMRSGIGPASHLRDLGIGVLHDAPGVGENLHDHPTAALHHAGPGSGYGLTWDQAPAWAAAPLRWLLTRRGRMASNFVEAGAFLSTGLNGPKPDVQVHFLPYHIGWRGRPITAGSGYTADVCVCRPRSRGRLTLTSPDPRAPPMIDPNLLSDPSDAATLAAGFTKLRDTIARAPMGRHAAPEAHPGDAVRTQAEIEDYVRSHCGTAYHPVGTLAIGGPVAPDLSVTGVRGLWAADASVMPSITSANTNAPSMMIGHRAAGLIATTLV